MNITKIAFSKKQFVLGTIFLLAIAGFFAYKNMPRAENPLYTVRIAKVITNWPGASPERVEQLVTDKIEKRLQAIPEIDYIKSESKTGVSVITVNILDRYKNLRPIWDNVRRKVNDAIRELPESAQTPIVNDEYGDIFGIVFGIVWDGFTYAQIKDVADNIRDELLEIDQVAKVEILGIQDERIFIEYNNDRLKELSLSVSQIEKILKERNIVQSGGIIHSPIEQIAIEPTGNYIDVADIKETLINIPKTNNLIKLSDIAEVYRGYIDPPKSIMHTTGEPSLGIAISMKEGGNILQLGEEVQKQLAIYEENYPIGIQFQMIAYQPERVIIKISEFVSNLIQAIIIVCAVMLLFLGFKTGLVVASLIPITILITMIFMSFFDIGLDQISLASLIIALGMLVDNAIVMSESILVQMQAGKKPIASGIDSAKELKIPLLISSLTTSAAFLPFYLAKSGTGEYVGSLFLVVTMTLLGSWLISLTMIPLFCVLFLQGQKEKKEFRKTVFYRMIPKSIKNFFSRFSKDRKRERFSSPSSHNETFSSSSFSSSTTNSSSDEGKGVKKEITEKKPYGSKFYRIYSGFLLLLLKRRTFTLWVVIGIFALSLIGFTWVPKIFYPPSDTPMFTAEIELPVGSSIWRTKEVVQDIEKYVEKNFLVNDYRKEGIEHWAVYIGDGGPRYRLQHNPEPANPYYSFFLFSTTDYQIIQPMIEKLDHYLFEKYPDVKPKIRPLEEGTPVKNPVEVRITGKDINTLFAIASEVKEKLSSYEGTRDINDDWGRKGKKIVIDVDQDRAKRARITNADIATSLESAITGVKLTEFREEDELIPMILRSEAAADIDLIKEEAFNVYSQETGRSLPIAQVANVKVEWEPTIIFRRNRVKTVTVFCNLETGYTASEIDRQVIPWLQEKSASWPLGYKWAIGGENEESGKAQKSIFKELPIAGIVILLLLMAQFNSLKRTAIILTTIPLSVIGVVFGLLVTGSSFGIMTLLGMISLAGIVINNAIVLLDRIELEKKEGASIQEAILFASQKRLRPILLTTITTISSLIPLLLGGGPLWETMAIAIIFGLMVATLLTLGVVPVLYALFYCVKF